MKTAVISSMAVLAIMLSGCASHEIKALTPEPIQAYRLQTTEGGLSVAAEPFTTKDKVEAVFTIDLTAEGYCPILLVMENRSADNVLVIKDDIELIDSRGNVRKPIPANVMVEKFKHNAMAYAILGFGIFSYMSAEDANKKMVSDLSGKELPAEKVLIQNRKTHGVVYFELGPGLATLPNAMLNVPFHNMRTGKMQHIKLRMAESMPLPRIKSKGE